MGVSSKLHIHLSGRPLCRMSDRIRCVTQFTLERLRPKSLSAYPLRGMRRFGGKSSPKWNRPGGASSSQQPLHRSARGETAGTSYTLSRDGHAARDELAKAAARRDSGGVGRRSV